MIDLKRYNAGFIQEKRKDLEFLETVDYERLERLVDSAIQSGSSKDLIEAKQKVGSYGSRILRDRSSQVAVKNIDDEINRFVSRYQDIQKKLNHRVQSHLAQKESQFKSGYGSKTPDIPQLREVSEEYACFEGHIKDLDATILQYAGFSRRWSAVETEVSDLIKEYQAVKDNKGLAGIRQRAQVARSTLQEVEKDAPRKLLRGVHKAYRYQNLDIERLEKELKRFESEDFAKKKKNALNQKAVASDFIELLQQVKKEDAYTILEEFSRHCFETNLQGVAGTIYFGALPREHAQIVKKAKAAAKACAIEYQDEFKKNLHMHSLFNIVDNQSTTDLKEQRRVLQEEYGSIANVLYKLTGDESAKKELEASLQYVSERLSEIQDMNAARKEAAEELARAKDQLEEAQNALEKEKKSYHVKEKRNQEEIQRLAKEKEAIARSLEAEKKTKTDLQQKVDDALSRFNQIKQQIEQSRQAIAQEISTKVDQKLQRVEERITSESEKRTKIDSQLRTQLTDISEIVKQKPKVSCQRQISAPQPRPEPGRAAQSDVFDFDLGELLNEKEAWEAQFNPAVKLPDIDLAAIMQEKYGNTA